MPDRAQGGRSQDHALEEAPAGRTQHNEVAFLADASAMISSAGSPCRTNSRTRQRWRSSAGIQSQMSGGAGPNRLHLHRGRDDRAEAGAQAGGQAEGVAGYVRAVDRTQNPANRLRGRPADREQRTGLSRKIRSVTEPSIQ